MMDHEGRLTVHRAYGLTAHLLALKLGQSCYVSIEDYNAATIRATIARLKKSREINFTTVRIKRKNTPFKEIKVTRTK